MACGMKTGKEEWMKNDRRIIWIMRRRLLNEKNRRNNNMNITHMKR